MDQNLLDHVFGGLRFDVNFWKMREIENVQKFPLYASIAVVVPLPVLQYSKYCPHGRRYYCWGFS
jgi:hypothetical protein